MWSKPVQIIKEVLSFKIHKNILDGFSMGQIKFGGVITAIPLQICAYEGSSTEYPAFNFQKVGRPTLDYRTNENAWMSGDLFE